MATYTAFEPQWKAQAGYTSPTIKQILPGPYALWRSGDFLTNTTTGTISYSLPAGSLIATAGPSLGTTPSPFNIVTSATSITQGAVTVSATVSAGAPAATYWVQLAYSSTISATSPIQSLPTAGFIVNVSAGLLPTFNVSATGSPTGSVDFLAFLSTTPNVYWYQGGAVLGSNFTPTSPLTNYVGAVKAAASVNTNILGMADCDSDAGFVSGVGGNSAVGKRNVFGPSQSTPPGWTYDPLQLPVVKCQNGYFILSLVQQWNGQLYSAVGLNIDANTGYFVADSTQTACATIVDKPFGPTLGDVGDYYARVVIQFTASTLI